MDRIVFAGAGAFCPIRFGCVCTVYLYPYISPYLASEAMLAAATAFDESCASFQAEMVEDLVPAYVQIQVLLRLGQASRTAARAVHAAAQVTAVRTHCRDTGVR